MTHAPRRAGFTLIELLVVISVLALLVGIVLPSLGSARETSRRAKCLSNLRSIGQGFSMYLKDSKDRFPLVRPLHEGPNPTPPTWNDPSLLDLISDYLDAPVPRREIPGDGNSPFIVADVYKCPADHAGSGRNANGRAVWEDTGCSYEYFPGFLMLFGEMVVVRDPAFGVTKAYEKDRVWPIAVDFDDFHKIRKNGIARNAVFFPDYHAGWMIDIDYDEMSKFIDDMRRYGGVGSPPGR
jgi:prepilin-type N-terminal cleavage/methylation domain-containing protein